MTDLSDQMFDSMLMEVDPAFSDAVLELAEKLNLSPRMFCSSIAALLAAELVQTTNTADQARSLARSFCRFIQRVIPEMADTRDDMSSKKS